MDLHSLYLVVTIEGIIPAGLLNQGDFALDNMLDPVKKRIVQVRKHQNGEFWERYYKTGPRGDRQMRHRGLTGWGPKTLTVRVDMTPDQKRRFCGLETV